jgi:hypothetical protein
MIGNPGRLDTSTVALEAPETIAIAAGVLTVKRGLTIVTTETGATDDLVTIDLDTGFFPSNAYHPGFILQAASGKTITLKTTGNIKSWGAADIVLSGDKLFQFSHDSANAREVGNVAGGGGGGSMTSFDIDADTGTAESVADGELVMIAGGTGIDTVVSATRTVTINIDSTVATLTGAQTLANKVLSQLHLLIGGFKAIFTHANSADRTYTFPDYNGTVATLAGTETFTNKTLTSARANQINDTNGNEAVIFTATASAVNEITVANAATGTAPIVSATGSNTDISIELKPKGAGSVGIGTNTPSAKTAFDVVSTTQASRPFPTMNSTQRDAITSPVTASVIYNSTTSQYEWYNGAAWVALGGSSSSVADFCDFRLSLTSGVPIMTSNVTAATTLYAVPINIPYTEGLVTLKNGSTWETIFSGEPSVTLAGATASRPHDVFGYYDTGNMAIEILAWTNATTRATAISVEDGHPIKSGDATRRYLGTIRITGTTGQCEFSPLPSAAPSKLLVWNLMHQVPIPFRVFEATDTWSYSTATWRQANASGNNQVEVVTGMVGSLIDIVLTGNAVATTANAAIAMGEDSTTARATQNVGLIVSTTQVTALAKFNKMVPLGYHYYAWLEIGNGSAVTWIGDSGVPDTIQSGFQGNFYC